ncbi:MAG: FHA domain-containing protein [Actinomycetota bacterium]|nr:FHA domain-containing protein [Actinomycetota bacterium]
MPQLVLELLKYVFLVMLYIFIARAVKAVYVELRPQPTGRRPSGRRAQAPGPARAASRKGKSARKVAIVEGASSKGKSFELGDELIIGRADKCHIVLDDTYVSQMHARIYPRDGTVMLEDLGSTNGTYLNRRRITGTTELHRGDQVKIGKTVLELRR